MGGITVKDLRRNVKSRERFHIHIASQVYLHFCSMLTKLKLQIEKMDYAYDLCRKMMWNSSKQILKSLSEKNEMF